MMRCCAPDVPLPFSPVLEKLVVPNENMILDAVKSCCKEGDPWPR